MAETTIYIVDDDESARRSVAALVRSLNYEPKGYASAEEFLAEFDESERCCVVTDLRMGGMSGLDLQEELDRRQNSPPIIIITAYAETPTTVRAIKRGAVTLLEKPCRDHQLVEAINQAIALGEEQRAENRERETARRLLDSLTDKEWEVLRLMVDGTLNKQIAAQTSVSVRTVESRRRRIFNKTNTNSVAELVRVVLAADDSRLAAETR